MAPTDLTPTELPAPPPATRISTRWLYIPLGLLALVIAGWSGVWVYAKGKTGEIMDAWMAREARLGREWACPDRAIGGFPFRIEVSCVNPTFVSKEPGRIGTGSLAGLAVTARVVDPKQVIAIFASPLKWTAETGGTADIAFAAARASYRGTQTMIEDTSIEMDKPVLTLAAPGFQTQTFAATRTELHLRRAPGAEPATDIAASATGVQSELLNGLLADAAPGALDVRARLAQFAPALPKNWQATLEAWRGAGGEARIEKISLTKGPIALNLAGAVKLDDQRRLEGEVNGTAQGASALLAAFGINAGGGGGLLGALLGGGQPRANAPARALPFVVRAEQGRLYIGPIPGPRLRPLY